MREMILKYGTFGKKTVVQFGDNDVGVVSGVHPDGNGVLMFKKVKSGSTEEDIKDEFEGNRKGFIHNISVLMLFKNVSSIDMMIENLTKIKEKMSEKIKPCVGLSIKPGLSDNEEE